MTPEETRLRNVEFAEQAIRLVMAERIRQDGKWGEQNHDPFTYLTILLEEIGEFAHDALENRFRPTAQETEIIEEAVHVAAVATAMVECILRDKWCWPYPGCPAKEEG